MDKIVLVTGGTGYLGSWVVQDLLHKGYSVRVAVRSMANRQKFSHLLGFEGADRLSLFEADLLCKGAFDLAAEGADAIIHMASPFTLRYRNAMEDLIVPALEGTRNVLGAASKSSTVKRVVLTSSIAAVFGDNADFKELGIDEISENYFNFSSTLTHQPYSYSKVEAEREAWRICNEQRRWSLVVINPTLVMGPSLTRESNSESIQIMSDLIGGKYRLGVPYMQFGFVDVRDVANAHIQALETDNAQGRYILVANVASLLELSNSIARAFPNRFKLPRRTVPKALLYIVGWLFRFSPKFIKRNVGYSIKISNRRSVEELGLCYTNFDTTVGDMVTQMLDRNQ